MIKYDFKALQNGSDIRGVALPGVEGEPVTLDSVAVSRLAKGFLLWLKNRTGRDTTELTIAIGRDSRLSGPDLVSCFAASLAEHGARIYDCGLASTPAMFMSTVFEDFQADGSVMVTASHLPWNRNGLKFFSQDGGLDKGDIADIIIFAESDQMLAQLPKKEAAVQTKDLMTAYAAHLRNLIIEKTGKDMPLSGMKICVDAGNGAGGFYATEVLQPLGADISASQFLEPDGNFPNHAPNPENKEAMQAITAQVQKEGCDLGLIFDTDVDRSSAVDENGREISRNGIVAMAAALIAKEHPGTTVVTDSITSNQLTAFLEDSLGLKHLRFKRGYRNVINKSQELNSEGVDSQLAIETSGHAAYKDNYFLDDGAFLATRIVVRAANLFAEGRGISSLIASLKEPAEAIEVRLPITAPNFSEVADVALSAVASCSGRTFSDDAGESITWEVVEPNYEGVRIAFSGASEGWFLLRKSLHDPILPLNVEAEAAGGTTIIRKQIAEVLSSITGVDTSKL